MWCSWGNNAYNCVPIRKNRNAGKFNVTSWYGERFEEGHVVAHCHRNGTKKSMVRLFWLFWSFAVYLSTKLTLQALGEKQLRKIAGLSRPDREPYIRARIDEKLSVCHLANTMYILDSQRRHGWHFWFSANCPPRLDEASIRSVTLR